MRNISTLIVVALIGLAFGACADGHPGAPETDIGLEQVEDVGSSTMQCGTTSSPEVVLVRGNTTVMDDSELQSTINSMVSGFNSQVTGNPDLTSAEEDKLWSLAADNSPPSSADIVITVNENGGTGTGWCGSNDGLQSTTGIHLSKCSTASETGGSPFPNPITTVLHETWDILLPNPGDLDNPFNEATEGCSLHASNPIPTATQPCVHEVQFAYEHCDVRPNNVDLSGPLVTGVFIDGPGSLFEDSTAEYEATFQTTSGGGQPPIAVVLSSRAQTSPAGEAGGVEQVGIDPLSVVSPSLEWSSNSFLDVDCSSCNPTDVTGLTEGSGQLTVELDPAADVVYPWPSAGPKSISVEAEDPPPPPPDTSEVATLVLSPSPVEVIGQSPPGPTVTATAFDDQGNPVNDFTVDWSIGNTSIAYLQFLTDTTVEVWPNQNGRTSLTATVGNVSAFAMVTVDCGPFACF